MPQHSSPCWIGTADPLRTQLLSEPTSLGECPSLPRRLAVANGSGTGANQGFAPRAQVIRYEYSSLIASLTGNVWALPDQVSGTIFQGSIRILFSTTSQTVTVNNTAPWDGAPGGTRASFAELDATTAPYGDVVALHPSHCFIPIVSALALATSDPFFNVANHRTVGRPRRTRRHRALGVVFRALRHGYRDHRAAAGEAGLSQAASTTQRTWCYAPAVDRAPLPNRMTLGR